jgi:hypothetical protein
LRGRQERKWVSGGSLCDMSCRGEEKVSRFEANE